MKNSFLLFQLQRIDSQIDMANKRSSEILLAMQSDTSVMTAKVEHDELISQLNIIKKDLIFITDDTEKNKTRIDQCSHSLYSGGVKNPKELQDLQSEFVSLKKQINELEENQLDKMISQEKIEELISLAEEKLLCSENDFFTKKSLLVSEKENLEVNLVNWEQERMAISGQISETILELYEKLRKSKRGIAVTTLQDGSCFACGTTLTPSQNQAARSQNDLFYCPTCQRIIFTG